MRIKLTIIAALAFTSPIFAADCENMPTQTDMNICSYEDADASETELNRLTKENLAILAGNPNTTAALDRMRQTRASYIKAHIELFYPTTDDELATYGSSHPVCVNFLYQDLIEDGTKNLKSYLELRNKKNTKGCSFSKVNEAEARLTLLYRKALTLLLNETPQAIENLRRSQQAWIEYRDAFIKLYELNTQTSPCPACVAQLRAALTESRTAEIKQWYSTPEEDGICLRHIYRDKTEAEAETE